MTRYDDVGIPATERRLPGVDCLGARYGLDVVEPLLPLDVLGGGLGLRALPPAAVSRSAARARG